MSALARFVALAVLSAGAVEARPPSPQGDAEPARDAAELLSFDPRELPRAEVGRWEALLDPEAAETPLELDPEVRELYTVAQRSYLRRDYPRAIGALRRVLHLAPDLPPALQLLGTALFRLQRYGDAKVCFERLLEHAPGEVWRTQALGHCYYSLGLYEEAQGHYERVLAARPEDAEPGMLAEARRGLALALERLGRSEEALEHLHTVVDQRPDHADAWAWIGRIHHDELRLEEALDALERARSLEPYEPRPWFLLLRVYEELGREEEAAEARRRWEELDRVAQEIRSVEARLELDPRDYALALRLVELEKSIDHREGVRHALERLLVARPENLREVDVRIYVLETLLRTKDLEGAARAAEALEAACPDEPETWRALQTYYARIGDAAGEVRAGERYLRFE